jgi:hypothetical protein
VCIRFLEHVTAKPATYSDWSAGEWKQETSGKENHLPTPYLELGVNRANASAAVSSEAAHGTEAAAAGGDAVRPEEPFSGSWSALSDAGEVSTISPITCSRPLWDAGEVRNCTCVVDHVLLILVQHTHSLWSFWSPLM